MPNEDSLVGTQIGHHIIKKRLGQGGMAIVYLAHDMTLNRDVCLKTLRPEYASLPQAIKRFNREARAMARFTDSKIIHIFGFGELPNGAPFFSMEYLPLGSLAEQIAENQQQGQTMAPTAVLTLMQQIAEALTIIHQQGMVHRDLKPANILLKEDTTPVLADLGIVAVANATRLTRTGKMPGTPHYMAPEQILGENIDGRTDIYALGVILYEMLGGRRPFSGPDGLTITRQHVQEQPPALTELNPTLSETICQIVHKCLEKSPNDRYQSARELAAALHTAVAVENGEIAAPPPPGAAHPEQPSNGRPLWQWAAVATLPVILLIAVLVFGRPDGGSPSTPTSPPATRISTTPTNAAAAASSEIAAVSLVTNTPTALPTATATSTPTATATPSATWTPRPSLTSLPQDTVVTSTNCLSSAGDRWGTTIYTEFDDRLGCPTSSVGTTTAAFQIFNKGLMIWREDLDVVYVLYYHNGTYSRHNVSGIPTNYANALPDTLKGAFGYLWNTNQTIRDSVQNPTQPEFLASNFTAQSFANGTIFYFLENNANNYILFANSGTWLTRR